MRVIDLINTASEHLKQHGFENHRLEVERMLGSVLGLSRIELYVAFDRLVTDMERDTFRSLYRRRLTHEPLQHIIGVTDFKEITVKTDKRALIPRPETEYLVEIAVEFLKKYDTPSVADIGTGSGVIALSIAHEIPESRIIAVDISPETLRLAEENARILGLSNQIRFINGNMLDCCAEYELFDAIVSNPPYVETGSLPKLQQEIRGFDPVIALDGGADGLRYLSVIAEDAYRFIKPGGLLLLECGSGQGRKVKEILDKTGKYSEVTLVKDLAGYERIVKTTVK